MKKKARITRSIFDDPGLGVLVSKMRDLGMTDYRRDIGRGRYISISLGELPKGGAIGFDKGRHGR